MPKTKQRLESLKMAFFIGKKVWYLKRRKKDSLASLKDAIQETERQRFDSEEDRDSKEAFKHLNALLQDFLYLNDEPERLCLRTEYEQGFPLTGDNGIRKRLAAIDLEFFGRAYFPHYFVRSSPEFHRDLDKIWTDGVLKRKNPLKEKRKISRMDGSRRVVAAPRGHAKSTTLTFKGTLHSVLYEYKHYPIILSDSSDQAEGFLDSIRSELEENEMIIEDFGHLEGRVWKSNVLLTKTNIKVEAIGSGKKIRGRKHKNWRPDLIVLDDIENDENVRTIEQRNKLSNWFKKAVSRAGDSYTDIIYIGTLLHYDSLLANTLKNPSYRAIKYKAVLSWSSSPLWDEWEKIYTYLDNEQHEADALAFYKEHEAEMLKGTEVLWKEKNSYYDLMVIKITDGDASFNSELQNEPINPDDCLFNEEWFDYYNEHEVDFSNRDFDLYGAVDPSLGKSKKSDYSAIITLAKHRKTGYMYVIDADIERRHPDRITKDILEKEVWLRKTYGRGYLKFGCETVQFQWFLKEEIAKASAAAGLHLPIEEIQSTGDKTLRVESMQPDIKNKYIKFNQRHKLLLEQLKQFPMGSHDDGPDALEMARTIAKKKAKRFRTMGIRF